MTANSGANEAITPAWVGNKIKRIFVRLWRRDFIRRRSKYVYPPNGAGGPAYAIAYNEHGAYCVPMDAIHRPASRYVMAGRVWEAETLAFIAEHLGEGDIIHAGAFFGDFLPFLSKHMAPGALVWAFEPNRANHKAAQLTCSIGDLDNVRLFEAGLGPDSGAAKLVTKNNRGLDLGSASFIAAEDAADGCSEEIDLVSLDQAVPEDRRIAVLHLDVEGFEEQALSGALKLIERCRPVVLLETTPPEDWMTAHLYALGYARTGQVDNNHVFTAEG
jgi:FkbM family methyltransferase